MAEQGERDPALSRPPVHDAYRLPSGELLLLFGRGNSVVYDSIEDYAAWGDAIQRSNGPARHSPS